MIQKSGIMFLLLMAVVITAGAVDLDREGRDPAYVESIVKRSQKIVDRKSTRLNSSHLKLSRMPSSA